MPSDPVRLTDEQIDGAVEMCKPKFPTVTTATIAYNLLPSLLAEVAERRKNVNGLLRENYTNSCVLNIDRLGHSGSKCVFSVESGVRPKFCPQCGKEIDWK